MISLSLHKKGFRVRSFGTGSQVKLPGPALDRPNVYTFDTTYDEMYKDLYDKNAELGIELAEDGHGECWDSRWNLCKTFGLTRVVFLDDRHYVYTQNGILHMLDRNRRIKPKPERFQATHERFDVIITCEERVYDQVIEELESRVKEDNEPVHIINIDIQDNHEEATIGAFMICDLVTKLSEAHDLDNDIDEILQDFETRVDRMIHHTAIFY